MKCNECGKEITTCPSCGGTQDSAQDIPEREPEGFRVDLSRWDPEESRRFEVHWPIVLDALILLLVAAVALTLAFTLGDWGSSGGPEDTVDGYFQAVEENRTSDIFDMLDPLYLEKVAAGSGMSMDELRESFSESTGFEGEGSVAFEDLTYSTTVVEYATVEITGGEEIDTDADGETSSMSLAGQELVLVKRDGRWYLDVPSMFGQ